MIISAQTEFASYIWSDKTCFVKRVPLEGGTIAIGSEATKTLEGAARMIDRICQLRGERIVKISGKA